MRILMLDNELPPLGGGMGTANLALLKQFAQVNELEIDMITSALGGKIEEEYFSNRIKIYKVPVWNKNIHHSSNRELIFYAVLALLRSLKLLRKHQYDLCFAWSTLPAGVVALALNRLNNLPYMLWISGPDIPGFERRYEHLYPLLLPLIRRVWRSAERVIAKCKEEVEMLQATEPGQRVEIIPNGVDLDHFHPGQSIPQNGPFQVICSARLIERKGQHYLIRAIKQLHDDGVDVIARLLGTGDSLGEYKRLANELGIEDKVQFEGYIPREEIPNYYAHAHTFILPSYNEGMSLSALEAMASGLPLLLTRTGGTDNLVVEGVNGFTFDWGEVEAMALHISQLAKNRKLAQDLGKASRERAHQYSWEIIAKQYIEIFYKTLH